MAIYEYYCPSCKKKFERRQSMSSVAVAAACDCGTKAERMLSMFAAPRAGGDGASLFEDMGEGGGGGGCCGGGGGCACGN